MIILPSLEIVPAKYNGNILLSQIPIDGSGDFTVTRATSATRVNASGLIESAKTNLALQSENFLTTWSPQNSSVTTGTTVEFTAPDGTTSADLITTTASIPSFVSQNFTIASGTYTISVFAKAGNYGLFRIANVSSAARAAWFNLDAGAVTGTVNGGTASMQNYGNGWYRCIYSSSGIVSGTPTVFFAPSNAPNDTNAVSGSTIYFWGAQLEEGSSASEYIPTTTVARTRFAGVTVDGTVASGIPRLDYFASGGVVGCPALLVEPSATNSIRNNSMVNASAPSTLPTNWSNQLGGGITQTIVGTGTENGVSYIDIRVSGTQSNTTPTDIRFESSTQITASNTQTWSESAYLKIISAPNPPTDYRLYMFERSSGGGFVKSATQVASLTTTLTRYSFTRALDGGATVVAVQPALTFTTSSGSTYDFTVRIGYPQMELGSVATSVIPTTTAAITRNADVISVSGAVSGSIGQTEGTIYAEVDITNLIQTDRPIVQLFTDSNNRITLEAFFFSPTFGLKGSVIVGGSTVANMTFGITTTGIYKLAIAYKQNDFVFYVNGTQRGTDTSGNVPSSLTAVHLGHNNGTSQFNNRIRAAALYTTRLSNTQLALLTSPYTSYSQMASALSYTLG